MNIFYQVNSFYKEHLKWFVESILNAYSMVLFTSKKRAGLILLFTTFLDPKAGISGLLGVIFTNQISAYLGVYREKIRKGLYGFNGLLVGLAMTLYNNPSFNLYLVLYAGCVLLVIITIWLEGSLGYYYGLPVLSLPFVIVTFIIYMAFFNYNHFDIKNSSSIISLPEFPNLPILIIAYIKSLGSIFFQTSPWAGVLISFVLFYVSRISFLLSIVGFITGSGFQILLGGNLDDINGGLVGFNYILTAIALGGIFLVPSPKTFILTGIASISVALVASFTKIFFHFFNLPVLSFPFTIVTLLFLYTIKQLRNANFKVMDLLPGSPEENLDYYNTRLKRFGGMGLYLKLPFLGEWCVSQGYNGKYTHKEEWSSSLDFMALGNDGKVRKGLKDDLTDYFTYGLPVIAVGSGRVVKVVSHIEDNRISEVKVEKEEKWGNLVIIEHAHGVYSNVSHLKKDSITVKEGEYVVIGTKLGLAGNSGRSPEPHLHLHFQSSPEIGASTIEIPFTQFIKLEKESKRSFQFNSIPQQSDTISNLIPEINLKNFFTLSPGTKINLDYVTNKSVRETWYSKIDLFGGRFLEDEKGNILYFFLGNDYFASLDYQGETNSPLFLFFISSYRVPFFSLESEWEEAMTYKHLSGIISKILKDIIAPFSDIVSYRWLGKIDEKGNLNSTLTKNNREVIYTTTADFSATFPGSIQVTDKKGIKSEIRFV